MLQCSIICTAKKMGYHTIVIDPDSKAIGQSIADEFIVVDANDYETTLEIAESNSVKGLVTSATDNPLIMMAKVAMALNLPFPSEDSIENTINKFKLKHFLQCNNIPCAKGVFTDLSDIEEQIKQEDLQFPLIVKPIDSSGSRGVYYCMDKEELEEVSKNSIKYSKSKKVLVEEYLDGPEISVEALVQYNELHIIQITDKTTTSFPYNVEMGHLQPSRYYEEYYDEIYHILSKVIKVLNLNNCALHPEMKLTNDGIKIVEIGPRLGGDFITSHLTPLSSGINMEEQLVKIAVGEKIDILRKANRYSSVLYFDFLTNPLGRNKLRTKIGKLKENISAFELYYNDSLYLPVITNSMERHGHVVFSADSLEKLFIIKDQILNS